MDCKNILMKQFLCAFMLAVVVLTSNNLSAQFRDIPASVTNAFKEKYPEAKDISWEDRVTAFQAKFNMNDANYEARFNKDGNWLETEKHILMDELPSAVRESFQSSKFSDWSDPSAAMIQKGNGGTEYRIFVTNNTVKRKYLYFSEDGKLLKEAFKL